MLAGSQLNVKWCNRIVADVEEGRELKVNLIQLRCYRHLQSGAARSDRNNEKPNGWNEVPLWTEAQTSTDEEPLLLFIRHNQPIRSELWDTSLVSMDISLDIRQGTWAPVSSHWLRENYWTPMMTGYIITGENVPAFACTLLSETWSVPLADKTFCWPFVRL